MRVLTGTVIVLALCLVAVSEHQPMVESSLPQAARYQIVINPEMRADTFLLDAETGRIWKPVQFTDIEGDPIVWRLQVRIDNPDQLRAWSATQSVKKTSQQ